MEDEEEEEGGEEAGTVAEKEGQEQAQQAGEKEGGQAQRAGEQEQRAPQAGEQQQEQQQCSEGSPAPQAAAAAELSLGPTQAEQGEEAMEGIQQAAVSAAVPAPGASVPRRKRQIQMTEAASSKVGKACWAGSGVACVCLCLPVQLLLLMPVDRWFWIAPTLEPVLLLASKHPAAACAWRLHPYHCGTLVHLASLQRARRTSVGGQPGAAGGAKQMAAQKSPSAPQAGRRAAKQRPAKEPAEKKGPAKDPAKKKGRAAGTQTVPRRGKVRGRLRLSASAC